MDNFLHYHPASLPEDIRLWAREMRASMTDAESMMWKLLRNRRLANTKFRRQHPIGRYILDFYCADKQLCIELDGGQHGESSDYDAQRDALLAAQGIRVLRFWNDHVLKETDAVLEAIWRELAPQQR